MYDVLFHGCPWSEEKLKVFSEEIKLEFNSVPQIL